jgi:hypothetical protein
MDDMAYVRKVSRCTSKRSRKDVFCFEVSSAIDGCLEEERAILEVGVLKSLSSRVTTDEVRVRSGFCLGEGGRDRRIGSDFESHSWLYENNPTQPLPITSRRT